MESNNFFGPDFYPTPRSVIEEMCHGLNLKGKNVLEPSSGSGSIIEVLKQYGAKTIACEKHPDLSEIVKTKCDNFLKHDFMEVDSTEVSHIDFIIANPPFSNADRHILHMWKVAPAGCTIISLCNFETINNGYTSGRKDLARLIKDFGSWVNLGNCFSEADRKTDVEVALIKLFKPKSDNDTEFEGYFDLSEEYEHQENGLMQHSEIREIVSRYVGAVKMFNEVEEASSKINDLIKPINSHSRISFGGFESSNNSSYAITRDDFKKKLQKSAWKSVFNRLNMQKYVTKGVMENINKFVEQQVNVPFTLANIYKMIEMILGTHGDRMQRVIVEAFDKITQHHSDNRCGVEGWKTNDCFMVNRRFILPGIIHIEWDCKMGLGYYSHDNNAIEELTKALCFLTGRSYDSIGSLYEFMQNFQTIEEYGLKSQKAIHREFGQWYEYGFLKIKGYKKGTIHCEFLDEKVWEQFNIAAVKAKGWQLPSTTKHKYRAKEAGVEIY